MSNNGNVVSDMCALRTRLDAAYAVHTYYFEVPPERLGDAYRVCERYGAAATHDVLFDGMMMISVRCEAVDASLLENELGVRLEKECVVRHVAEGLCDTER